MLVTFSFAFNTETKEGVFEGNVGALSALQILQRLVIAKATQEKEKPKEKED